MDKKDKKKVDALMFPLSVRWLVEAFSRFALHFT